MAINEEDYGTWREHSNDLGDWCPWSGERRTPEQSVGDGPHAVCPAMCRSSADDDACEGCDVCEDWDEEDEPETYDDNDMYNPYPRDREDGEGLGLTRPSYTD